ncbi:MAG: T9SS type A sorting domain-containing protein [Cytophagales bacterium]|nr:T9SS type A sorting domain-containing protein [Cytophagales bacterium]
MKSHKLIPYSSFILFFLFIDPSFAQLELGWAKKFDGIDRNDIGDIEIDHDGNVYTGTCFIDEMEVDGRVFQTSGYGTLIVKHDPDGRLLWSKLYAKPVYHHHLYVDDLNNLYLAGNFNGELDFEPGLGKPDQTILSGRKVHFILKLDPDGQFQWVKQVAGKAYYGNGSFYINCADTLTKIDISGNVVWQKPGVKGWRKMKIVECVDGAIWVGGDFRGYLKIGKKGEFETSQSRHEDLFLAKFDSDGDFVSGKHISNASSNVFYDLIAYEDEVIMTGAFMGSLNVDPGYSDRIIRSKGHYDIIVTKHDASMALIWAHGIGGAGWDSGRGLAVNEKGEIGITGSFQYTVDFDPGVNTAYFSTPPACVPNIYLLKLDRQGDFLDAAAFGNRKHSYGTRIEAYQDRFYVSGPFQGTIDFDPEHAGEEKLTATKTDYFVLRMQNKIKMEKIKVMAATPEQGPIGGIPFCLITSDTTLLETNASGFFEISGISGEPFKLLPLPEKDSVIRHGVSTLDIVVARRHILGLSVFSDPYSYLAADVNDSKSITALDLVCLREFILGASKVLPSGTWKYTCGFSDPGNPFSYICEVNDTFSTSVPVINYTATRMGDMYRSPTNRRISSQSLELYTDGFESITEDLIVVPVKTRAFQDISGYQFSMKWDKDAFELVRIENRAISGAFNETNKKDGVISCSWDSDNSYSVDFREGTVLFDLVFKVSPKPDQRISLALADQPTETMAIDVELNQLPIVLQQLPERQVRKKGLFEVHPNPVVGDITNVKFFMNDPSETVLSIIDFHGAIVFQEQIYANEGLNYYQLNLGRLGSNLKNGIYFYRLETPGSSAHKKLLIKR